VNADLRNLLGPRADPVPKRFRGGTHRCIEPGETLARAKRFFPLMGITRVANITGLDRIGIPVIMVCRPNSRSLAVAQGKGVDVPAATASGVMESAETWHAETSLPSLILASAADLMMHHRIADVDGLPRSAGGGFHNDLPILWCEGLDLLSGAITWVPWELVHTNYTLPLPGGSGCFQASSNGLASGNHLLEAISHAVCEVVERDATTLWTLLDEEVRAATRIDLTTIGDPLCQDVIQRFDDAGVGIAVWETTSDIRLPSFRCIAVENDDNPLHLVHSAAGMGCHPLREIALLRAITEAAQSRLTIIAGSREDVLRTDYERIRLPDLLADNRAAIADSRTPRSFRDVPTVEHDTFRDDVFAELEALRAAGVGQVIAVDLTRTGIDIPVVRIVVPRLESSSELRGYQPNQRALAMATPSSNVPVKGAATPTREAR
jgi:YcaO-like protein with predicted kinase domain